MKGLKQLASEAMSTPAATPSIPVQPVEATPVEVSGEAVRSLSDKLREWSGWPDARLMLGKPGASPFAECDHTARTFTANPDLLVLNPNRVLLSVTPFRLRQEAVLTGCLLHEAGHARHTHYAPRTAEATAAWRHGDGGTVSRQTAALARLMEEPRVEGLMARDADRIGAAGLGWTMRASAAHLVPTTSLSAHADQKVMDLITSWALRAGRQIAFNHHVHTPMRSWVQDFTTLLHSTLRMHLITLDVVDPDADSRRVLDLLIEMIRCEDDRGTTMIDTAREILSLVFPETDDEDMPEPNGGCKQEPVQADESDPEDQSDDEQAESKPGEDDEQEDGEPTSEDGEGEGEAEPQAEDSEPGDEPGEGTSDEGDSDEEDGDASDSSPAGGEGTSDDGEEEADTTSDLAKALEAMEAEAKSQTEDQTEDEADAPPPTIPSDEDDSAPTGETSKGSWGGGWRQPTKDERSVQHNAEMFLRNLIDVSESSKVTLTDTPSATVDGAALAAWRAGGGSHDPRFFRRTQRMAQPSPPVKVAILVDVSGSMEELQKPSALLSWALASAAVDLRNFAGRGVQVESTLIHWGSKARVIQRNGEMMPGIKEDPCLEGTATMHDAHDLVAEQIPGFFDFTEQPVNRLLVHFTDWELSFTCRDKAGAQIKQALAAGVNMISVVPRDYSERRSDLSSILADCRIQRGAASMLKYNPMFPERVWDQASEALGGVQAGLRPAPFDGF